MEKKKQLFTVLAFLIPFIVYLTIFYINGLLTDKTILTGDMHAQYYPLFNYLKEVFNGNNSIFYSFYKGLGGTMFGTMFYYLSSPLNVLLVFIDKINIPEFMTYLIILKLSFCGLTMYIYMSKKFKTHNILILVFSLCYSLMGYNLNYFINIMWLDVVFLTPIVLLGIDKIIENKSPVLYIITLFISIFSNYYMAYMLCIFCVIYFLYELLLKYSFKKDKQIVKKLTTRFFVSSILTGLMCSFFLIPCILEMLEYGRTNTINEVFTFDYNFFDIFSKTYIGSLDLNNTLNYSSMNSYCGIIMLPLAFLFITNKNINKKERILTIILILFMVIPCFIGVLNYIWHLFTIPNFYSYRYSFLLSFFLITIAYKSYVNLNINKKEILLYLTFYLIISFYFIIITYFGNYYDFLNYKLIWITIIFLITYFIIMYFFKRNKNIIISILILFEIILNAYLIFNQFDSLSKKKIYNYQMGEIIDIYKDINNRIETNNYQTFNDSILSEYNGISQFLSTSNNKILKFIYNYGYNEFGPDYPNLYIYGNQNYILESMLGLKYILSDSKLNKYTVINKQAIEGTDYYIYENTNSVGYGFMVKNKCNNIKYNDFYSEELLNCLLDSDYTLFKEYKKNKDGSYNINRKDYYYVYMDDIINTNFEDINKEISENLYYKSDNYFIYSNNEIEKIKFKFSDEMDISSFKLMYFDYDLFSSIKYNKLQIESKKNNYLKGNIKTTENGILMITLPYESGFNIYVDGNLVNYFEVANTFIGIDLEKGLHTIEVKYHQPGIKSGVAISIISAIICCSYIIYNRKSWHYEKNI